MISRIIGSISLFWSTKTMGKRFICPVSHSSIKFWSFNNCLTPFPVDPPPYIDGVRINSPHYLCKITPKEANSCLKYTLVISQYEKSATIHYTLRAYSTGPFVLKKLGNPYKYKDVVRNGLLLETIVWLISPISLFKEKNGKWTAETAGGCLNNRDTYHKNPVYQFTITGANDSDNQILIDLKGPKYWLICIFVSIID